LAIAASTVPVHAQQVGAAVGFARIPERIGDQGSDNGLGSRLGIYFGARRVVSFGFELGFDRFNNDVRTGGPQQCLLPGGAIGDCFFRSEHRDLGISFSGLARIQARGQGLAPYAVIGLGVLNSRTRAREEVTDGAGNHLSNFEFDGTMKDTYAVAHVGVGLAVPIRGTALAITIEGRATPVLYNYSGTPAIALGQSLLAGIRLLLR